MLVPRNSCVPAWTRALAAPVITAAMAAHVATFAPAPADRVLIDATAVPLNPTDPSMTSIGDFRFAGGLVLKGRQSALLHELSDLVMTGPDRFAAVGDGGVILDARFVLDDAGRLKGVTEANLTRLVGKNGRALVDSEADAEGLTVLPSGDRLISFERDARIWLYPRNGGLPRDAPWPKTTFEPNAGMEAITAAPDLAADAYLVGDEATGATWTCRLSAPCVKGATVDKPKEFGLVSMTRLPDGLTAYLLRAYDPVRRSRIRLRVLRGTTTVAGLDLATPLNVDNFEGLTSTAGADGRRRFYLISDDNNSASQRTLLFAFDWSPR